MTNLIRDDADLVVKRFALLCLGRIDLAQAVPVALGFLGTPGTEEYLTRVSFDLLLEYDAALLRPFLPTLRHHEAAAIRERVTTHFG